MKESNDILKKFGNKNPFSVPENYFEDFLKKIVEQTAEKHVSFFEKTKPILYFAAMFAGFILIFQLLMPLASTQTTSINTQNLASNQTEQNDKQYREFLLENIDEESMIEYLLAEK
ncbi:MAG: hypothetical protein J6U44_03395 [Paludibacteraceae bacterium]|nr:hypothetical protein [Paludibacteraceae bacterium]